MAAEDHAHLRIRSDLRKAKKSAHLITFGKFGRLIFIY
jgi:hypothetical protein